MNGKAEKEQRDRKRATEWKTAESQHQLEEIYITDLASFYISFTEEGTEP
jgi:hypothetical protein